MSTQTGSISFEATGGFNSYAKQNYATLSQIKGQFATCGTGAATAAKVATIVPADSGWTLYEGATVTVKFTSKNTAATPTLNVNNTGAKQIRDYNGDELTKEAREWVEGSAMALTYDGTYWRIQDSNLMERVHSAETGIEQNANSIVSFASMEDNYTRPDGTTATNNLKSYVDQTAEGITTTIENITETVQHSGNLLPHTSVTIADREWLSTNIRGTWTDIPIVLADGYDAYKYDSSWAPIAYWSGYWCKLRANTYYTYSVDVYYTKAVSFNMQSLGHFQVYNTNSSLNDKSHEDVAAERVFTPSTIPANTWTRVSVTFLTNSLDQSSFAVYPRFNIAAGDGTLYFKNAQLEYGKIATGWSPSSFDLSTVTNTVNSVKQTADANMASISGLRTTVSNIGSGVLDLSQMDIWEQGTTSERAGQTYESFKKDNTTRIRIEKILAIKSGDYLVTHSTDYSVGFLTFGSDKLYLRWTGWNASSSNIISFNDNEKYITALIMKAAGGAITPSEAINANLRITDTNASQESVTTLENRSSKIEQTLDGFSSTVGAIVDETVIGTNILTGNALNPYNWTISAPASASYTKTAYGTAGVKVQFSTVSGYERLYSPAITVVSGKKYTLSAEYTVGKDYIITSGRGGFGLSVYKAAPTDTFDSSNANFVARAQFLETATRVAMKATITFTAPSNTIYLGLNGAQINDSQSGLSFTLDKLVLVENISSRMSSAETTINQTANNVLIKATESDTTAAQGGQHLIESLINVAPSGVTISADKVNIEGATIFTTGRLSSNTLDSKYDPMGSAAAIEIGGTNYILNSAGVLASGLGSEAGSRAEYRAINVGQSYMDIPHGTQVTISFDLYMTVNTANPILQVYNTNNKGPKAFSNTATGTGAAGGIVLNFTATANSVINKRVSVTGYINNRTNPTNRDNFLEFYSTYGTSNWFSISNLKLEKGNKATDWTEAPKNDNLLLKTSEIKTTPSLTLSSGDGTWTTYDFYTLYKPYNQIINNGDFITVSFNWSTTSIGGNFHVECGTSAPYTWGTVINAIGTRATNSNYIDVTSSNTSGYVAITFQATSSHVSAADTLCKLRIRVDGTDWSGKTITLSNAKAELGNKATGWTSAPQDIYNDIENAASYELLVPLNSANGNVTATLYKNGSVCTDSVYFEGQYTSNGTTWNTWAGMTGAVTTGSKTTSHSISSPGAVQTVKVVAYNSSSKTKVLAVFVGTLSIDSSGTIATLAPKNSAVSRTQRIYYQSNSTTKPTTPGTASSNWVTDETGAADKWTLKRMSYSSTKPYIYTCEQKQVVSGTVSYTPVLLDDTTTVIDGGKIITGSIAANRIDADSGTFNTANIPNLNASKINAGDITADRIKTNVVNAINATVNKIDAKNINVSSINIGDLSGTISGKNLALDSDQPYNWQKYTPTTYEIAQVKMTEDFIPGETYTVTIWGGPITRSDKSNCWYALYWGGGIFSLANATLVETGIYRATFTISTTSTAQHTAIGIGVLNIYNTPAVGASGTTYSAPITKIQIEKGNVGTEWEPAQEELPRPNLYKTTTEMRYIGSGAATLSAYDDSYHGRTLTITTAGGTLRMSHIIPKTNVPYTVSFILDASVATTITVDIMDNTTQAIKVPKGISKVIFTSTPTRTLDSTYHFIDMVFANAGTYKMEDIKVEPGTIPTAWISAEQISNYIYGDSSGIRIASANPSTQKQRIQLTNSRIDFYNASDVSIGAITGDAARFGPASAGHVNIDGNSGITLYDNTNKKRVTIDTTDGISFWNQSGTKVGSFAGNDTTFGLTTATHLFIDSDGGINFYDKNSKRRTLINHDGLHIYNTDGSTEVATFASTATIGTTTTGRITVTATGVGLYNKNNKMKVSIGTGNSIFYGGEGTYPYIELGTTATSAINIRQSATSYTSITSSGLDIYTTVSSAATKIASFGTTATIGATNNAHFIMAANKLQAFSSTNTTTPYFEVSASAMKYGSYTVANTSDVANAGNTASLFITPINDNEIKLHSKTGKASNNYAKMNSDGLWVYKQNNLVAKFSDSITLGKEARTRVEVDFNSFRMLDRNGNKYCHISDLRDENGSVYLEEEFVVPDSGKVWPTFEYSHSASNDVIVYYNQTSYAYDSGIIGYVDGTEKRRMIKLSTNVIPVGSTITIKYRATDDRLKGYTFGIRNETDNDKIGGLSFSEGYHTSAIGYYSHSEGEGTTASGPSSHAQGSSTVASGANSHAEGWRSVASGEGSHAEGGSHTSEWSIASGAFSHAEGISKAAGRWSHAENGSTANGDWSHAEGEGTANGRWSHAEGNGKATGSYSHAEGSGTASGYYSHASGAGTIAGYDNQFVCGKYNSNQSTSLFEIGNGTNSKSANALTVDTSGNLTASGTITANKDLTFGNGTTATLIAKTPSRTAGVLWVGGSKKAAGDANGTVVRLQGGGLMLVGGGEYPTNRYNLANLNDGDETLFLGSDGAVYIESNGNTIANRKTFTFGTDGSFNSPGTIKQNGTAVSLSGTSLFENASGRFSGKIDFSETAANFTFIEIYCKDNDGRYCYTKVWSPNGKTVNVTQTLSYGGNFYIKSKAYTISGAGMDTANTSGIYHTGEVNAAGSNSGSSSDILGVVKVIGYK